MTDVLSALIAEYLADVADEAQYLAELHALLVERRDEIPGWAWVEGVAGLYTARAGQPLPPMLHRPVLPRRRRQPKPRRTSGGVDGYVPCDTCVTRWDTGPHGEHAYPNRIDPSLATNTSRHPLS